MKFALAFATALVLATAAHCQKFGANSDELIEHINAMGTTWTAGRNFDRSVSVEQLRRLNGLKLDKPHTLNYKTVLPNFNIPAEFDARQNWPLCASLIGEIRDQGNCGSCWAHGAVESFSDRICIASNAQVKVQISANDLTACDTTDGGCGGGYLQNAWEYIDNNGVVTGGLYNTTVGCEPYTIPFSNPNLPDFPTPACTKKCIPSYPLAYNQDKHYVDKVYAIPQNVNQIQQEIMTNGPVEAGFQVYEDFMSYKHGVYQYVTGDFLGGHAIKILGWGVENGVEYWLCANSWNTNWGLKGFFKIRRGTDECGIEENVVAGTPKL